MNKIIFIIIGSIILLIININNIQAQTTKTTKADGYWSDPTVWTGGAIPDAANKASINHHIIIDEDVNILNLTINASSSLTFDTIKAITFTVADEININGVFKVDSNKIDPLLHIIKVGSNLYGPGSIDFYEVYGDAAEIVFIGNSNSEIKDLNNLSGVGDNGNFGGLKIEKNIEGATVSILKPIIINASGLFITKGILDLDSLTINAGDNINKLILDSLGTLRIASSDAFSCAFFESYNIHKNSTIEYYMNNDYEMTNGWDDFDGNIGNLIISGIGEKYFGDSSVSRVINQTFKIENETIFNLDNDTVEIKGELSLLGTLKTTNDNSYLICNNYISISDTATWMANNNDVFEFYNGLAVSQNAYFISGEGQYIFKGNNQSINVADTIRNIVIENINLLNTNSLSCNSLNGGGSFVNNDTLDFSGEIINCNMILDSTNNKVIYSNHNPKIKGASYEILEIKSEGISELAGEVIISKSLEKKMNGLIYLADYDLIIDTAANFIFNNPSVQKMIVTNGNGSLVLKSNTSEDFMTIYPVGTITNGNFYTPMEITSIGVNSFKKKFIAVKAQSGQHLGMEDTLGLLKYWSVNSNFLEEDSINIDLKFKYNMEEVIGNENNYEVRYWSGNKPWLEPALWNINTDLQEIIIQNLNTISFDWTAGDSTAITSKVDDLELSLDSGIYYNSQSLTVLCETPDVSIYYTINGEDPDNSAILYSEPLLIDTNVLIKFIGIKEGWQNSNIVKNRYNFKVDTVVLSLISGTYKRSQSVQLSTCTENSEIYYTLDGSDPDISSFLYTSPIIINSDITIKAIAYKMGYTESIISEENYIIEYDTIDAPIFSKMEGEYNSEIVVEITTDTINTQIYYTLDGSIPNNTNGTKYISPITISNTSTVKAIAYKEELLPSNISSVTYTIIVTSIRDITQNKIIMFPNPAHNCIFISNPDNIKLISIFNINGIKVLENSNNLNFIDISNIESGIYILKLINSSGNSYSRKIIKK